VRIGLFSDTFPPETNGVASSTGILRDELERHGQEVYVITTRAGSGMAKWDSDGRILRLAGMELKSLYGYVMTTPFHLNAFAEIRRLKLDVIHAQTEFGVGIFARICAKSLNIPLVSTYHTTYEDYVHYINFINSPEIDKMGKKWAAQLARLYGDSGIKVIAPSEKTREMLLGYKVRREIYVVPTGLELFKFDPAKGTAEKRHAIRSAYGIGDEEPLIIYVGRLASEKSVDLVLRAFARAKAAGMAVKFLIVGGGPDEELLKQMAKDLKIDDLVLFAGKKLPDEVPDYYRSADGFVSASLTETQGMTFIEAMASGLPVFARHDPVLDDLVVPGKTGYFFTDENDFPDRLKQFLARSPEEKQADSRLCLEKCRPYSSEVFYERVMQVYRDAVDSYASMHTIDDVSVKDDFVQLFLTSDQTDEEIRLLVSLDDYCSLGIRKGGKLSDDQIASLQKKEAGVRAYQGCLRRIAVKDRTRKEMYDWLTQNTECDIETVNGIIDRLEAKGYINDEKYCEESIQSMKIALQGEEKIIRALKKKGLPYELIRRKLDERPDDEQDNALAYAQKVQSGMKETSVRMKRRQIEQKMLLRGFSQELCSEALAKLDFAPEESREIDNLRHCANKAKRRYEKKYSSSKLRNMVFRYCAAQGYSTEDIYAILDEMEWKDEQ